MADIIHEGESFVSEHPYETAAVVGVAILLVWYLFSGSSAPATSSGNGDAAIGAAASLSANQAGLNAGVAQANIAAGVSNAATQAGLTLGVTQSNNALALGVQQSSDAASIANTASTNATALATTQSNDAVQAVGETSLASEFTALAQSLTSYATAASTNATAQNIAGIQANAGVQTDLLDNLRSIATNPTLIAAGAGGDMFAAGGVISAIQSLDYETPYVYNPGGPATAIELNQANGNIPATLATGTAATNATGPDLGGAYTALANALSSQTAAFHAG